MVGPICRHLHLSAQQVDVSRLVFAMLHVVDTLVAHGPLNKSHRRFGIEIVLIQFLPNPHKHVRNNVFPHLSVGHKVPSIEAERSIISLKGLLKKLLLVDRTR